MCRSCQQAQTRENDWLPDVEEANVRRFRLAWQDREVRPTPLHLCAAPTTSMVPVAIVRSRPRGDRQCGRAEIDELACNGGRARAMSEYPFKQTAEIQITCARCGYCMIRTVARLRETKILCPSCGWTVAPGAEQLDVVLAAYAWGAANSPLVRPFVLHRNPK